MNYFIKTKSVVGVLLTAGLICSTAGCFSVTSTDIGDGSKTPWGRAYRWQAVTAFGFSGWANGIGVDSVVNLYVVGTNVNAPTNNDYSWLVYRSTDHGTSWSKIDEYKDQQQIDYPVQPFGFGTDASGNLYAVGSEHTVTDTGTSDWIVRRSGPSGSGWTTVDRVVSSEREMEARAIGTDAAGAVYVVGQGESADKNSKTWSVRKSVNGASGWGASDTYQLAPGADAEALGIARDKSGNLYVAGFAYTSSDFDNRYTHWIVRKRSASNGSWVAAPVDDFTNGSNARAMGVAAAPNGDVYVVGYSDGTGEWIVRKNLSGQSAWSTVDKVPRGKAYSVAVDADGVVYVTGAVWTAENYNTSHAYVRTSADGGATWTTVDRDPATAVDSINSGVTVDPDGRAFTCGGYAGDWYLRAFK